MFNYQLDDSFTFTGCSGEVYNCIKWKSLPCLHLSMDLLSSIVENKVNKCTGEKHSIHFLGTAA